MKRLRDMGVLIGRFGSSMRDTKEQRLSRRLKAVALGILFLPLSVSAAFIDEFVAAGSGGLDDPRLFLFDGGSLFVANGAGGAVARYSATTGAFVNNFASINQPRGVTLSPDGNSLYVSGGGTTDAVRQYNVATGALIGTTTAANLNPFGLTFGSDGNLYVADISSDEILRFDAAGAFIDTFVAAGVGGLDAPRELVFGSDGNLYVSSADSDAVLRYNGATGAFIDAFATGVDARGLVFGPDNNLYVASFASNTVRRYDGTTGAFIDDFVTAGSGNLMGPVGVAFGPDGNFYVSSFLGDNVLRYTGVPEPATTALLALGLLGVRYVRRKRVY